MIKLKEQWHVEMPKLTLDPITRQTKSDYLQKEAQEVSDLPGTQPATKKLEVIIFRKEKGKTK